LEEGWIDVDFGGVGVLGSYVKGVAPWEEGVVSGSEKGMHRIGGLGGGSFLGTGGYWDRGEVGKK
jgi:hypothetical protein